MTEAEWLTATHPRAMLEFLKGKASDRKLRLFSSSHCRLMWHLLTDNRSREAVEVIERFADGNATEQERATAELTAKQASEDAVLARQASNYELPEMLVFAAKAASFATFKTDDGSTEVALAIISASRLAAGNPASSLGTKATLNATCCSTFRELVGNPFRPVSVDPAWLTSTVLSLARHMYETRDFSPMTILADALMDAGCNEPAVLSHCRCNEPHVRGCWLLDHLLGKE